MESKIKEGEIWQAEFPNSNKNFKVRVETVQENEYNVVIPLEGKHEGEPTFLAEQNFAHKISE